MACAELLASSINLVSQNTTANAVTIELTRQEPVSICDDQQKLRQVLVNLLSNAIEFSPQGATVSLSEEGDGFAHWNEPQSA